VKSKNNNETKTSYIMTTESDYSITRKVHYTI